ncbi:MAG: hypothetical protein PF448_08735 [Bacteroidales bacterium]|jgi:hypothetical protein|nr:hypothetical protein [Bacteroidales bacterium]
MKEILKKSIPYVLVLAVLGFAYALYDAYKKSRDKQGWINGLKQSLSYYNENTNEWRTAIGWQEELNEFVRKQAALPKFEAATIPEVVRTNIDWSYNTSKPLERIFIKV